MKKRKSRLRPKSVPAKRKVRARRRKSARTTSKRPGLVDALVDNNAKTLGLSIDPAWRKSIAFNLALVMRHAALVDEFKLSDETEPAPVYRA
jgi:hypothetical protein